MAIVTVPLNSDLPDYQVTADLNGTTYIFGLRFSNRDGYWFLSLFDEDESPIFEGLRLVLGIDYCEMFSDERIPEGALQLFNYASPYTECGRDDLGESCQLVFGYTES